MVNPMNRQVQQQHRYGIATDLCFCSVETRFGQVLKIFQFSAYGFFMFLQYFSADPTAVGLMLWPCTPKVQK